MTYIQKLARNYRRRRFGDSTSVPPVKIDLDFMLSEIERAYRAGYAVGKKNERNSLSVCPQCFHVSKKSQG